jgi:metallo-beta-lactamase family protein
MKLHFLGAADGVTGSRHLVESAGVRVLLDCGLFQGFKQQRERNWAFPEELHHLDAVVLSHAHLDHSGWLPVLVRAGFRGPVYASAATCELARVLLLDSAHLQEEDARRANRGGWSRHAKALPLYTRADAERALALLQPLPTGEALSPPALRGLKLTLTPAGHLLGACSITLQAPGRNGTRLVFSGDLGRQHDLLMPPPQPITRADLLLVESTYGNRLHPAGDDSERLAAIVRHTVQRGGSVLLPTFAVGRAQALLVTLQRLKRAGAIPRELPLVLDSPMAIAATTLYRRHGSLLRIGGAELRGLADGVRMVETAAQSMRLAGSRWPSVILSASGMATGGRVLHHLKQMAPDARHSIVFAGFQVAGTRGARLVAGEREVKVHGQWWPVRAEVHQLEGFSGHADQAELLAWLHHFRSAPQQTFVVHGEPAAADTLRIEIERHLGWPVRVAGFGECVDA